MGSSVLELDDTLSSVDGRSIGATCELDSQTHGAQKDPQVRGCRAHEVSDFDRRNGNPSLSAQYCFRMAKLVAQSTVAKKMEKPEEEDGSDTYYHPNPEEDKQLEADIKARTGLQGHDEGCATMEESEVDMD